MSRRQTPAVISKLLAGRTIERVDAETVDANNAVDANGASKHLLTSVHRIWFTDGSVVSLVALETECEPVVVPLFRTRRAIRNKRGL